MRYYLISPEVAGGLGAHSLLDTSCHPPAVRHLHYEFDGWLGDCLVESFPCFIVTESVVADLRAAGITGMEDRDVEISTSHEFRELHPDRQIGRWRWLLPVGVPGQHDISLDPSQHIIVSERVIHILRRHGLDHCDLDEFQIG